MRIVISRIKAILANQGCDADPVGEVLADAKVGAVTRATINHTDLGAT